MRMFHMKLLCLLVLGSTMLAGCTEARYYSAVARTSIKEGKDIAAESLVEAPCLMSVGAFFRLGDATKRAAVKMLCGGGAQ